MKTFIFVLVCLGTGFGLASYEFQRKISKITNVLGIGEIGQASEISGLPDAKPSGKIEVVGGNEFDFGTMRKGTKRRHTFVFKNVGEAAVRVAYKSSTCKCTVGTLAANSLLPGEKTDVELEWLAEGALDQFAQTATITSDVVNQEEIKLTITGQIGQAFVFEPAMGDIRDFMANEERLIEAKLYSFEEAELFIPTTRWGDIPTANRVEFIPGTVKRLEKGEVPKFADARYVMDFKIKLSKGFPPGILSTNMVFVTKQPDYMSEIKAPEETINFPIQGRAVSTLRVIAGPDYNEEKNIFSLGSAESKVGISKNFLLAVRNADGIDIKIKLDKVTPEEAAGIVKVTVGEPTVSATQKIFKVTIEIPPGTPPVAYAGAFGKDFVKIVLETNVENASTFPMFIKFRILD